MGSFNATLLLLKEKQNPQEFLPGFNEKLKSIGVMLEKGDCERLVFNDSRSGEEKEPVGLNESMEDAHIISLICSWKGLGLLSYRHPDFRFAFSINYLSWDDESIDGFDIGFYSKEFKTSEDDAKHKKLVSEIGDLADYQYIVGDIGNASDDYINLEQDLPEIKAVIENKKFDIDIRK